MPDLLFISDIPKVEQIKGLLQPLLKLEIGVTAHPELPLKDISNHRPAVICIQEQLAGRAAGDIAGQIMTTWTVQAISAPLFVLLREGNDAAVPSERPFEHIIDLNQPVEQLAKSILRLVLQPAFRLRWGDVYLPHGRNEAAVPTSGRKETESAGAGAVPPKGQIPAELLKAFEHNYRSRRRGRRVQYAVVSLAAFLTVSGWYLTSGRFGKNSSVPPAPQATENIPTAPAPSTGGIVQKAVSAPGKPATGKVTASKLPSFIPENGRDDAYSRLKPGWERYTEARYEFRILRSEGRIKTIEILATTQHAISEAFLKSVLSEITGSSTYRETSQEEKNGFLIKRGRAGDGATILIYTQKSRVRSFVVSIS